MLARPSIVRVLFVASCVALGCTSADSGLSGTGGSRGTGGQSGHPTSTGKDGSGGSLGSGGLTPTGGAMGSGGAIGTGGMTGTGGATAAGGQANPGGATTTRGSGGTGGAELRDGGPGDANGGSTGKGGGTGGTSTGSAGAGGTSGAGGIGTGGGAGGSAGGGITSAGGSATGGRGGAATGGATNTAGSTGGRGTGGTSATGGTTGGGDSTLCPSGITQTIAVAKDGSGQFTTVQAAVNSIASGSSAHIRINIKAGTYTEKLTIASRTNLCLVGADATNTILTYGDSNASTGGTSTSASVHISADDFSAANLTFQNSYGSGSQAVALRTTGDRQQFLNCRFVGYQDTLYTHNGTQYFRNCYVQGNTDYVFGNATAVLENCEARNVEGGSAVAAPNTDISTAYGIVFLGGKFTAVSAVKANSVALGRPWGADGAAAYLRVDLGAHIIAAGFVVMSGNQPQNARFHEYQSTGSGANTSSRSSYQLSASQAANYAVTNILAPWTPSYSQ
jgi:pectin methylesterase-like acyl-CoA thioesterase